MAFVFTGLRRRSTAARLLRLWVRIPPGVWMLVCYVCCVLSDRGLCDELITRPRGVLPNVARRCVWSRNLVWRGGHNPRWAAEPKKIILCSLPCSVPVRKNVKTELRTRIWGSASEVTVIGIYGILVYHPLKRIHLFHLYIYPMIESVTNLLNLSVKLRNRFMTSASFKTVSKWL
jgi:hypothetical protein